jgi:Arc/MetJ-type ribon-helix-helix transcriptional regulator
MPEPTFPLFVHDDERETLRTALRAFRDDLGHEEHRIAAVLDGLLDRIPADEPTPLTVDAAEMKVTYTALRSLLDDSRRDQADERGHLHALLERLPGEHDIRAIDLDAELDRREREGGATS